MGFVERVDQKLTRIEVGYRWWPESWVINCGSSLEYQLGYTHEGIRERADRCRLNFDFSRNVEVRAEAGRAFERFGAVDFNRQNYEVSASTSTSRLLSLDGSLSWTRSTATTR